MTPATGKYVQFSCESCGNVFNSKPDLVGGVVDQVKSSLFGSIPIVGGLLAGGGDHVDLNAAFNDVKDQFRECAACSKVVCLSCYDQRQNKCSHCRIEAAAQEAGAKINDAAAQAAGAMGAGFGALAAGMAALGGGVGGQLLNITCPSCKKTTLRAPNCQQCGQAIPESALNVQSCSKCKAPLLGGAKFCAGCGTPA